MMTFGFQYLKIINIKLGKKKTDANMEVDIFIEPEIGKLNK